MSRSYISMCNIVKIPIVLCHIKSVIGLNITLKNSPTVFYNVYSVIGVNNN